MVAHGRGPSINAVAIAFLVVNLCAIALRCYTRIKISRVFDYNDAGMLLCMVCLASGSDVCNNQC